MIFGPSGLRPAQTAEDPTSIPPNPGVSSNRCRDESGHDLRRIAIGLLFVRMFCDCFISRRCSQSYLTLRLYRGGRLSIVSAIDCRTASWALCRVRESSSDPEHVEIPAENQGNAEQLDASPNRLQILRCRNHCVLSAVHSRSEPLGSPAAKCHPGQNSSFPRQSRPCASRGPSRRCCPDH
jgi:hypothetical protein